MAQWSNFSEKKPWHLRGWKIFFSKTIHFYYFTGCVTKKKSPSQDKHGPISFKLDNNLSSILSSSVMMTRQKPEDQYSWEESTLAFGQNVIHDNIDSNKKVYRRAFQVVVIIIFSHGNQEG